jgi:hypothetical protein
MVEEERGAEESVEWRHAPAKRPSVLGSSSSPAHPTPSACPKRPQAHLGVEHGAPGVEEVLEQRQLSLLLVAGRVPCPLASLDACGLLSY